jgi:hypothetical protein
MSPNRPIPIFFRNSVSQPKRLLVVVPARVGEVVDVLLRNEQQIITVEGHQPPQGHSGKCCYNEGAGPFWYDDEGSSHG